MNQEQLNSLCEAYQNVDGMTLHDGDPGNLGDNDSGITKVGLSWGGAVGGVMSATGSFPAVPPGEYPFAGLWDGTVFIEGVEVNLVVSDTIPVDVTVEHHAQVRS